jgi:hypothetical protein
LAKMDKFEEKESQIVGAEEEVKEVKTQKVE